MNISWDIRTRLTRYPKRFKWSWRKIPTTLIVGKSIKQKFGGFSFYIKIILN